MPDDTSQSTFSVRRIRIPGPRARLVIGIVVVILLPLTVVGVKFLQARSVADAPVEVVREFLAASRSGEVETALSLTLGEPTGSTDFLVPDAVNDDWEIGAVELQSIDPDSSAVVQARIIGPEDTGVSAVFNLESSGEEWRLKDPFSQAQIVPVPLPYFDINGHQVDMGKLVEEFEANETSRLTLLPGVYEFFPEANDLLDHREGAHVLLGGKAVAVGDGQRSPQRDDEPWGVGAFAQVEGADELLQPRVESYLDDCLAEIEGLSLEGCPFGLSRNEAADHIDTYADDARFDWELVEYPQVTLPSIERWTSLDTAPALTSRSPGLVEISLSYEGGATVAAFECPFELEYLYVGMQGSGEFVIGPREDPKPPPEVYDNWPRDGLSSYCKLL